MFTTKNIFPPPSSLPTNTSFYEPNNLTFSCYDTSTPLRSSHSIVDPSHLVPELNLYFSDDVFDQLFGIPFQDTISFTHFRSPHPSEILTFMDYLL